MNGAHAAANEEIEDDAALFHCFICAHEFLTDPPTTASGDVDRRPVTLPCCGNTVCTNCVAMDRAAKVAELSRNRKNIPCIHCGELCHSEKVRFETSKLLIDIISSRKRKRRDARNDVSRPGGDDQSGERQLDR